MPFGYPKEIAELEAQYREKPKRESTRAVVLKYVKDRPGQIITLDEVETELSLRRGSISSVLRALSHSGFIIPRPDLVRGAYEIPQFLDKIEQPREPREVEVHPAPTPLAVHLRPRPTPVAFDPTPATRVQEITKPTVPIWCENMVTFEKLSDINGGQLLRDAEGTVYTLKKLEL